MPYVFQNTSLRELAAPGLLLAVVAFVTIQLQAMRDEISDISERLVRVEVKTEEIATLSEEVSSLRSEMVSLRSDMGPLPAEVSSLRSEMGSLRSEMGSLRSEMGSLRADVGSLSVKVDDIDTRLSTLEDQESRRELLQELHRQLEIRFDESDEGLAYGGPRLAVDRLMLRAKPEVDAALADILKVPRSEPPMLLAQDLSNDLWARRMQFLNPVAPLSP